MEVGDIVDADWLCHSDFLVVVFFDRLDQIVSLSYERVVNLSGRVGGVAQQNLVQEEETSVRYLRYLFGLKLSFQFFIFG